MSQWQYFIEDSTYSTPFFALKINNIQKISDISLRNAYWIFEYAKINTEIIGFLY